MKTIARLSVRLAAVALMVCLPALALLSQVNVSNPAYVAAFLKPSAAGGGGATWYDVEISANADTFPANSITEYHTALVTAGQTGNAKKIRVYIHTQGDAGTVNMKAALYNAGGTLLASGSVALDPSDDGVYKEVSITPTAVTAATQYRIAFMFDDADVYYAYRAGSGALDIHTGATYGSFPYDPVGTPTFDDLARNVVAGIYVE